MRVVPFSTSEHAGQETLLLFFHEAHRQGLAEQARNVFNKVGTREVFTPEQQRDRGRQGKAHISKLLTASGLTSVHDAGAGPVQVVCGAPNVEAGRFYPFAPFIGSNDQNVCQGR